MSKTAAKDAGGVKVVTVNRKARHEFEVLEKLEAGLALMGSEVKSIRDGRVNLKDSFARIDRGEAFLWNAHVAPWAPAGPFGHEPERKRKLLLHRGELDRLAGKMKEKGLTLVPLRLFFRNGRAKVELGLVRGKHVYDKRRAIKERELDREAARAVRRRR